MRTADTHIPADTTGTSDVTRAPEFRQDRARPAVTFHRRSALIQDVRFPRRRDLALAWNVARQGGEDLSTWLRLGAVAIYVLACRLGHRLAPAPRGVPLAHGRAALWFDRHPVRFAAQEAPRQR